jgi:hypothetical protein
VLGDRHCIHPDIARVVRSVVLSVRFKSFVEAARLQGEKQSRILIREILPSTLPALTVEAALRFSYAIFLVASLGFLGVGIQPPSPNWGLMVDEARDYATLIPWAMFFPALAISIVGEFTGRWPEDFVSSGSREIFQLPVWAGWLIIRFEDRKPGDRAMFLAHQRRRDGGLVKGSENDTCPGHLAPPRSQWSNSG